MSKVSKSSTLPVGYREARSTDNPKKTRLWWRNQFLTDHAADCIDLLGGEIITVIKKVRS